MRNRFGKTALAAGLLALPSLAAAPAAAAPGNGNGLDPTSPFIQQVGPNLFLGAKQFHYAGANNYYPMYKSQYMVDDVLETAAAHGLNVFRMWSSLEIGYNSEGWPESLHTNWEGVYFQYLDPDTDELSFNDGPDGLERMDYIIKKAGELGIKLVLPLVNNWQDFGGIDQYVKWRELQLGKEPDEMYHSDFYTDPVIKGWYKDWLEHIITRVNPLTNVAYGDDPTIMTWELGNEPRCVGSGYYGRSEDCTTETLTAWADEMSSYIKSIDPNHLVSVGDEGFFCDDPSSWDWTVNCGEGVDSLALAGLESIDVMSYHLYPDHWDRTAEWGIDWIERHIKEARALQKPAVLGEYGWRDAPSRNPVFKDWTDTVLKNRGAGAMYWILSGKEDSGSLYPDYDGFTVYCPSPVCTALSNFSEDLSTPGNQVFDPVADHEGAVTEFETPVTFDPAANDIAYGSNNWVLQETIDLDPAADGQQLAVSIPGGTFECQGDGLVVFTPAAGFVGDVEITYTIEDRRGRLSNEASLRVKVKPIPGVPFQLFSFETGTQGWGPDWNNTGAGTVAQSSEFATHGDYSLAITVAATGWFGLTFWPPLDLSDGYTLIEADLKVGDNDWNGTWHNIAIHAGDGWTWCQGPGEWLPDGTTGTFQLDLLSLTCWGGEPDLSKVQSLLVYWNGDGWLDNIWVK